MCLLSQARPGERELGQAWDKADGRARATIGLLSEDSHIIQVRKLKTAREYWEALKRYHEKGTIGTIGTLPTPSLI